MKAKIGKLTTLRNFCVITSIFRIFLRPQACCGPGGVDSVGSLNINRSFKMTTAPFEMTQYATQQLVDLLAPRIFCETHTSVPAFGQRVDDIIGKYPRKKR